MTDPARCEWVSGQQPLPYAVDPGVCPDCYEDDCCGDCYCCPEPAWPWDDDAEECAGCGDYAEHLSSDGYCDGCVILGPTLVPVVTAAPLARYL